MTYEAFETGALGRPIELFYFERKGYCWPYTSGDQSFTFQGITYQPVTISRGAFERNDESGSSEVSVQFDRTLKIATQFVDGSTPYPVKLVLYRKHRNDADFVVMFSGVVANAELRSEEVFLRCVSPLSAQEKPVPRHLIMRTCPHVLYGPKCRLSRSDWVDTAGTIGAITANVVRVDGLTDQAADYYSAGVIKHVSTGRIHFIQNHAPTGANDNMTLLIPPVGWSVSDAVEVYAGCDRRVETCRDKFNNIPNFGGFPRHPERNPILDLKGS